MTELKVTFLGTGGSVAQMNRGLPATALTRENGETVLFDCGEGTVRQLLQSGLGLNINKVFLTHLHADHTAGLIMLIHNLQVTQRKEPLRILGPSGTLFYLGAIRSVVGLLHDIQRFDIIGAELEPGAVEECRGFKVEAFQTYHRVPSLGYRVVEDPRVGKFDVAKADALGVPVHLRKELQRGNEILLPGMPTIMSSDVCGPQRPGRIVVFTGDTTTDERLLPFLKDADFWVSEGTYADDMAEFGEKYYHSVTGDAYELGVRARVRAMAFNHLSPRYNGTQPLYESVMRRMTKLDNPEWPEVTFPSDLDVEQVSFKN